MDLLLLGVVLMWGAHFAVVKQALSVVSPMAFSVVRFAIASACLFALTIRREGTARIDRSDWSSVLLLGAIGAANQMFWMYGLRLTTSGKSALLVAVSPVFAALIRLAGGERVGAKAALGMLLAFSGVALIVRPGSLATGGSELLGDLLTLGAALAWGLYAVAGPRVLKRYSATRITAYVFAVTALAAAGPGLGAAVQTPWASLPTSAWWQLAYSTFLAGALSWVLWYQGVSQLGPLRVMLYQYMVPVIALAVSVLWLGEPFVVAQGGGALLVLLGTLIARLGLPGQAPQPSPEAEATAAAREA